MSCAWYTDGKTHTLERSDGHVVARVSPGDDPEDRWSWEIVGVDDSEPVARGPNETWRASGTVSPDGDPAHDAKLQVHGRLGRFGLQRYIAPSLRPTTRPQPEPEPEPKPKPKAKPKGKKK